LPLVGRRLRGHPRLPTQIRSCTSLESARAAEFETQGLVRRRVDSSRQAVLFPRRPARSATRASPRVVSEREMTSTPASLVRPADAHIDSHGSEGGVSSQATTHERQSVRYADSERLMLSSTRIARTAKSESPEPERIPRPTNRRRNREPRRSREAPQRTAES
jgi:hypothetical protein